MKRARIFLIGPFLCGEQTSAAHRPLSVKRLLSFLAIFEDRKEMVLLLAIFGEVVVVRVFSGSIPGFPSRWP